MTAITFRQLIDLAIGSPEPGHVNFQALQCLLYSFAEKLNIIEDTIDCNKYANLPLVINSSRTIKNYNSNASIRTTGSGRTIKNHKNFKNSSELSLLKNFEKMTRTSARKRMRAGAEPEEETAEEPPAEAVATEEAPPEATEEVPPEAPAPEEVPAPAAEEVPDVPEAAAPESAEPEAATPEAAAEPEPTPPPPAAEEPTAPVEVKPTQPAPAPVVESEADKLSRKLSGKFSTFKASHMSLDETKRSIFENTNITTGMGIMKDQLELAMEQLNVLTNLTLDPKRHVRRLESHLRTISDRLRFIQKDNVYITGAAGTKLYETPSMISEEEAEEEVEEEAEEEDVGSALRSRESVMSPTDFDLDQHLSYSPEKMLDELIDLKSKFCTLSNKVNEMSQAIMEQDCQRTMRLLAEMQESLAEAKYYAGNLRDGIERLEHKQANNEAAISKINSQIDDINTNKIDKSELMILLAEKADYNQLARKVSQEQYLDLQCRLEKQFCEIYKIMRASENATKETIANLRETLGLDSIDEVLKNFKDRIEQQIITLRDALTKYMEATDDECAAAGARIKVLQDLACVSCDTNCVMRTRERAKVGKLRNANATKSMGPLVAYELGSIRKSGTMGYYRKDEFPHAPHAWMDRQMVGLKSCVPRHAGGAHTVNTARDRVDKITLAKKLVK